MARIERINLEGTTYDLGAIASTTAPGMVQVGSGLSIDANGVLSATGGSSVTLYNSLGENTDGAITQKASREMIWATPARETVFIGTAAQGATITSSGAIVIGRGIRNASMTGNVTIGGSSQTVWNDDVAVGGNANAGSRHCTAVGGYSQATGLYSTAVGKSASAARNGSTALGAYAVATRQGEVNVGTSSYNYGYDGTNTRVIGGVHAGVDNTDAVNVAQLNDAIAGVTIAPATTTTLGGVIVGTGLSVDQTGVLSANSATLYPSTGQNTDGAMTQKATTDALALKADSSSLAAVATTGDYGDLLNTPSPYTLPAATANDLGGIKVGTGLSIDANGVLSATGTTLPLYTALGENTDGPITQQTARRAIYADSGKTKVVIRGQNASTDISTPSESAHVGYLATGNGSFGVALGAYTRAGSSSNTSHATALGYTANAQASYSVALGAGAMTSEKGEINVTTHTAASDTHGYNNTRFRLIRGVYPGVQDNDAVTVGQLNNAISSAISPITDAEIDAICV